MGIDQSFKAKSPALATLIERGYLEQASDLAAIDELLSSGTTSFYVGFDPTNTSIHIGNLFGVMVMRVLQKHGHRPICLMGGGTAHGRGNIRYMDAIENLTRFDETAGLAGMSIHHPVAPRAVDSRQAEYR